MQLSFADLELTQEAQLESVQALLRPRVLAPPRFEDAVTRAVLLLNNRERAETDPVVKSILIHAQDWVCLELEDWCHDILREW